MPQVSTARLMLLFTAVSVGTSLLNSLWRMMSQFFGRSSNPGGIAPFLVTLFMTGLVTGWLQSWLLARHRTSPRRWTHATTLGTLAGGILGYLTARELMGAIGPNRAFLPWLTILAWTVSSAACVGVAQAFALWGKRWTSETFLWLTGLLVVRLLAGALPQFFRTADEPLRSMPYMIFFVFPVLSAAVVGAGTAWLLDRLVFRVQPFEAGGRTVE